MKRAARILIFLLPLGTVLGDGGTVQLRKQVGSFVLTVFSAPVPLRVGSADLSVMVQKASNQEAILNARVLLELTKPEQGRLVEIAAPATRAQAKNKLLYATRVALRSSGDWQLNLSVAANGETVRTSGHMTVLPQQTPLRSYWPYFAVPPLAIFFFVMNQWLKSKRRIGERLRGAAQR